MPYVCIRVHTHPRALNPLKIESHKPQPDCKVAVASEDAHVSIWSLPCPAAAAGSSTTTAAGRKLPVSTPASASALASASGSSSSSSSASAASAAAFSPIALLACQSPEAALLTGAAWVPDTAAGKLSGHKLVVAAYDSRYLAVLAAPPVV